MIRIVKTACKKRFLIYLVFSLIFFGVVLTPHAEIYRWQDKDGAIQYSNTPPEDESLILDVIPTRRIPIVEDANGTIYYLNIPVGNLNNNFPMQEVLDQVALPPEILDQLVEETPITAIEVSRQPPLDVTALTVRLTELENTLKQEMTNRLEWKQEYLKSQSYINDLEQHNKTLKLALAQMETKIEKLQKTVAVTDIHVSALTNPQQQLGIIERKVDNIQAYVVNKTQQTNQTVTLVQSEIDTVKTTQQQRLDSLYAKLDTVESDIAAINKLAIPQQLAALSKGVKNLELQPQPASGDAEIQSRLVNIQATHSQQIKTMYAKLHEIDDINTAYDQQLTALSTTLNVLESETAPQSDPILSAQVKTLSAKLEKLDTQPQPNYDIRIRLAALETELENLTDALPASRRASTTVANLLESGNALKTITAYQSQQINDQTAQIEKLRKGIDWLKAQAATSVIQQQASGETSQNLITARLVSESDLPTLEEMMEKNAFMEAVIKHQTNALNMQKNRINAIEAKLEQLALNPRGEVSENMVDGADLFWEASGGRIVVVPRKERRDVFDSSIFSFFSKQQF